MLGLSLAFILSQDQTLRCNILYNFCSTRSAQNAPESIVYSKWQGNFFPSCTTIIVCSVFQFVPGLRKGRKKNYSRLVVRQACCFQVLPSKSLRYVSSSAVRAVNTLTFFFRMLQLNARFSKAGAKLLLFFDMTKYFHKKISKKCIFTPKWPVLGGHNSDFLEWIALNREKMGRNRANRTNRANETNGTNRVRHYETLIYYTRARVRMWNEGCETGIACRTHNNGCLSLKIAKRKKWMAFESFLAFYLRISEKSCNFAARKCVWRWKTR